MKFSAALAAAILSAVAYAAPAENAEQGNRGGNGRDGSWTSQSQDVSYQASTPQCTPVRCEFKVTGAPPTQANSGGHICGPYQVGVWWSGQFGPGNGVNTISVVDTNQKLAIYPSYTDKQLTGGRVVSPNQSYGPYELPDLGYPQDDGDSDWP